MSANGLAIAVAPVVLAGIARLLGVTARVHLAGVDTLVPLWRAGRPLIYAVWHGRILMGPWMYAWLRRTRGARRVAVLASRSRDGEIVARYTSRFGLRAVRGSSSRGGAAGLRQLAAALRAGEDVALVPDGPLGPKAQMQPGVVTLAALSGALVVPMGIGARPARRLNTWDDFLVPLPFARCALVFGEPVSIARAADRDRARKELERALDEATAMADRLAAR